MTRAEASRINGAKSRGPVTEEGKARSSQNNYRHGVYARRTVVLRTESKEEYEESKAAHVQTLKPRNTLEAEAVIDIVNARWKIRRIETQATHFQDCRRLIKEPEFRKNFIYLSPAMSETLAYHANCTENLQMLMMLERAENTCRRTISRSLNDILKARKIAADNDNPPLDEIRDATVLPVESEVPLDDPKPEPEPEPEPKAEPDLGSEPEPEPQKSRYEPEKPGILPLLALFLYLLLTPKPAIAHHQPTCLPRTATHQRSYSPSKWTTPRQKYTFNPIW